MITEQLEVAHRKSKSLLTSVLPQQQLSKAVVFWGVLEVQTPRRRSNGTKGWSWGRWALTRRLQAACRRSSLVLGLAGCFGCLPEAEGSGVPGMPSSVVSCNFGILPILLLTLPVIEELIFRPCSIQGHDTWRQRYQAEFASKFRETKRCDLPALEFVPGMLTTKLLSFCFLADPWSGQLHVQVNAKDVIMVQLFPWIFITARQWRSISCVYWMGFASTAASAPVWSRRLCLVRASIFLVVGGFLPKRVSALWLTHL